MDGLWMYLAINTSLEANTTLIISLYCIFQTGGNISGEIYAGIDDPGILAQKKKMLREILESCWGGVSGPDPLSPYYELFGGGDWGGLYKDQAKLSPFVADAVIANPPCIGHIHVCEALGIPLHIMFPQPWVRLYFCLPAFLFDHILCAHLCQLHTNMDDTGKTVLRDEVVPPSIHRTVLRRTRLAQQYPGQGQLRLVQHIREPPPRRDGQAHQQMATHRPAPADHPVQL